MYGNSTIWEGFPSINGIRKGLSHEQPKHEYVYVVYCAYSERAEGALNACASCIPSLSP